MVNLGKTFGLPYGLSDHHDGDEMLYAATALGAAIVEKGVTPEKYLADQDCAHAMFIDDIPEILKRIKNISKSLGNGTRYLRRDREKYKINYNNGVILSKNPPLINGDTIIVNESLLSKTTGGLNTIVEPVTPLISVFTLLKLLE